jgi:mono/diheme cytochrome c family protein
MNVMTNFSHSVKIVALAFLFCATTCIADDVPPFSHGSSFSTAGKFVHTDGAVLYRAICQGCHMPDARGAKGAGEYPALAGNPKLGAAVYPATRVLQGWGNMPSFARNLDDEQIAAVVNFVRTHFDNHYTDTLTASDVQRLRAAAATGDKQ